MRGSSAQSALAGSAKSARTAAGSGGRGARTRRTGPPLATLPRTARGRRDRSARAASTRSRAITATTKLSALTPNTTGAPKADRTTPARAGPTARAPFTVTPPSADDAAIRSRGTSSGWIACHAGEVRVEVMPSRKVKARIVHGVSAADRRHDGERGREDRTRRRSPDQQPSPVERVGEDACRQGDQDGGREARGLHERDDRCAGGGLDQVPTGLPRSASRCRCCSRAGRTRAP